MSALSDLVNRVGGTLEATGHLVHRNGDEGERHYLLGRGVHCGEGLELKLADGSFLAVRYEVEHSLHFGKRAVLYLNLFGSSESKATVDDSAFFRWPEVKR